jgi:[acyl-carrier-protein] S-malonyltransferase
MVGLNKDENFVWNNNLVGIFPGQGSQYVGMGAALKGESYFEVLKLADEVLEKKLSRTMLEGPDDELNLTENTQPAILTYSIGLLKKLTAILGPKELELNLVLGHSVGEYSALVAAGTIELKDAIKLVSIRGKLMQEAVPAEMGKMVALLRVPEEIAVKATEEIKKKGPTVVLANFNEPGQIVISGHKEACDQTVKWIEENYKSPFKAIPLKVSAPFHSPLMKPAETRLSPFINATPMNNLRIPYLANIDATKYEINTSVDLIKRNLIHQVSGAVKWSQSFAQIPSGTICLEIGPGKVLSGLAKKINPSIKCIPLDSPESWEMIKAITTAKKSQMKSKIGVINGPHIS